MYYFIGITLFGGILCYFRDLSVKGLLIQICIGYCPVNKIEIASKKTEKKKMSFATMCV